MSGLVTGDAVVLGLRPARLPSRAMAVALDLVVVLGVYLLLSVVLVSSVLSLGTAATAAVNVALFLLVVLGAPIAVETLSGGRSIGKAAFGLRVVRADGGPIRFRHALVRGAVGLVEMPLTLGTVATVASLVSADGRRLGDVFGGTLVVRERLPGARGPVMPAAPPWLAGRYGDADLSQVPEGLWLSVRQYLGRLRQLDPAVAWSMGVRLAGEMATAVGAPPPGAGHPADYLAALVAERQRRDAARIGGYDGPSAGAAAGVGPEPAGAASARPAASPPETGIPGPDISGTGASGAEPGEAARPSSAGGGAGFTPPG
ncbi:RDD family protein [Streptomyces sp. RFCAC02]|uniref:RDD family protein n=1 Tax=Streptomyces sp. RFCAC02 TaxID=2499143 RepID=UPI00101F8A38|nr:RDD family protein [Streptomyces sp. RFCAC02]